MSTSLLYHGFGVRGYRYVRTDYVEGEVWFSIEQPREALRCPLCDSAQLIRRGEEWRTFRTLPIGGKRVTLTLPVARVECAKCEVVRQVSLGFADPRRTYTKSFARYALELLRHMTIRDVAQHLGVGWDLIKEIQKADLQRRFKKIPLKKLRQLAIDEISIGKHGRYLTVVLDLKSGAVVFVGDGKGSEAVEPFWKRLRHARAKIQAVAMDMSKAYIKAVTEHLPKAQIVFDHFHIIKLFNEKLSDLRRELHRDATEKQRAVLKGSRWLLLMNPENLDQKRNEPERLREALELNAPLATAYYLKEDLRELWQQPNWRMARKYLTSWCARATASVSFDGFTDAQRAWLTGSFAKVCCRADSEEELMQIHDEAVEAGLEVHLITDSGRTEFHGQPTRTCLAIGPDEADRIDAITGQLQLL